ncbi:MAG TPA: rhomboid family intramembrane serine protease [Phycisphaerales bacterium]|nr:rhomboid family intramembrane serine protease [Phycisphaerales bacterium]
MLIPLGTDRPLRRPTLVNHLLVGANLIVFAAAASLGAVGPEAQERLYHSGWLVRADPRWWTFLTHAFLHAGALHLLGNMLVLWVFGPNVEDKLGRAGYLGLYVAAALVAGAAHVVSDPAPVVGASGAVAGVTGAYLVLFPRTVIRCIFLFFFVGVIAIPAWWFIGAAIIKDLYWLAATQQAMVSGQRVSDGVARMAHVAGYSVGAGTCLTLLGMRVLAREPYDLLSIVRQARRRRVLKQAALDQEIARRRKMEARSTPEQDARFEEMARARAAVSALISAGDLAAAAPAYHDLVRRFGDIAGAGTLSRQYQYDLANFLFSRGWYTEAAAAYDRFLEAYPKDAHAPSVRLMVALLSARYLNDPIRAKQVLGGLEPQLGDPRERDLARELLTELA